MKNEFKMSQDLQEGETWGRAFQIPWVSFYNTYFHVLDAKKKATHRPLEALSTAYSYLITTLEY